MTLAIFRLKRHPCWTVTLVSKVTWISIAYFNPNKYISESKNEWFLGSTYWNIGLIFITESGKRAFIYKQQHEWIYIIVNPILCVHHFPFVCDRMLFCYIIFLLDFLNRRKQVVLISKLNKLCPGYFDPQFYWYNQYINLGAT